jgi:protein-S-isoprenylcysteine O-methyltransferase Ste14
MLLMNDLEAQGAKLFRWRSFVPLLILPVAGAAAMQSPQFAAGPAGLWSHLYDLACILISFLGLAGRAYTVACAAPRTSGRNTREQRAEVLNTSGPYSIVRNPLYVANFLILLGMLLFVREWWLVAIATLAYLMYYERIVLAEEQFLAAKFGSHYVEWAATTPAMIPNFALWRRPECRFSLRIVLRREYNGFYLIVAGYYLLEWLDRIIFRFRHGLSIDSIGDGPGFYWTSFFLAGTLLFVTLRTIKKHTTLLLERPPK